MREFIFIFVFGLHRLTVESNSAGIQELVDDFFNWRLREWPGYGTKYGLNQHDGKLESFTESTFLEQRSTAEEFLQRCEEIDTDGVTHDEKISLAVLKDLLNNFLEGFAFRKYGMYNVGLPSYDTLLTRMKKTNEEDYQKILARYRLMGERINEVVDLLKLAVRENTTAYFKGILLRSSLLTVVEQSANNTAFYVPFLEENMPDNIQNQTRSTMQTEALRLIEDEIIPAVKDYRDYVSKEYETRSLPGVNSLAGGLDYYKACLKWHLTTDMTPKEYHQLGKREVERISNKMQEIMQKDGFEGTLQEYQKHLEKDVNNFYNTSEEVLQGYRDILKATHDKLGDVLLQVPDIPVVVQRGYGGRGYYQDPTQDGSAPGIFYASVDHPEEIAKFQMPPLTLHEAEPGHHTQTTYAFQQGIPNFRMLIEFGRYEAIPFNWLFYTAYSEGWALYAESLGEEMGTYTQPHTLFGKYDSERLRAARLVVDTGIHAFGWSVEESENYLKNHTTLGDSTIQQEVQRYIAFPGQACAYKIGELKIWELRKKAEEMLGTSFNLKKFHHEVLKIGPVPLLLLEDEITRWINETINNNPVSAARETTFSAKFLITIYCATLFLTY